MGSTQWDMFSCKASYSDKGIYRNHNLNPPPTRLKLTCVYEIKEEEKKARGIE
jgi:hypothetical protein